jgi:anti-sigma B factor antagonist
MCPRLQAKRDLCRLNATLNGPGRRREDARRVHKEVCGPAASVGDGPGVDRAAYAVVVLTGEVDATNSDELYDVLESVVLRLPRLLVVDLSALTFMDSTGLRMLLRSSRELDQQGGVLALASPQVSVARVLQLTRADQLIPVYGTVADAIAEA